MVDLAIPSTLSEVNATWLNDALANAPRFAGARITDCTLTPLGTGIGQMSVMAVATPCYAAPCSAPPKFVIKLHTDFAPMNDVARTYHMYEREVMFYTRFADRVPVHTPQIYQALFDEPSNGCVLVMELLDEWTSPDQLLGPTKAQAQSAVDHLARLTASFWNDPLLRTTDWLPDVTAPYLARIADDYPVARALTMERFRDQLDPFAHDASQRIADQMPWLLDQLNAGPHQVLTHYDFRVENLFFRDGDVAVIDWQLLIKSRPGWDFAYFIGTNLPQADRREWFEPLVERYLDGLATQRISGYDRAQFDVDLRLGMMGMTIIPIIGAASADMNSPRAVQLFGAIAQRAFDAVQDLDCLTLLPS